VAALRVIGWAGICLVRSPLTWWLLLATYLLPILPVRLGEIGIWSSDSQVPVLSHAFAFFSGLAGVAIGLALLSNYRGWSPLQASPANLALEWCLVALPSAVLIAVPYFLQALTMQTQLDLAPLTTWIHLTAIGLCVAQLPGVPRVRWAVLFFVAWVLPALSPPNTLLDAWIRPIFDAGSWPWRASAPLSHSSARLADFGPIIALFLLAAVLAPRSRVRS
jgi:hypothetical protein